MGIDIGQESVEYARQLHPNIRFVCEDIFKDPPCLREQAVTESTVLFLDINGNRNYKPVADALRTCLQTMRALRLVVIKSKELRSFLLHNGIGIFLRDIGDAPRSGDYEATLRTVQAIVERGGDVPIHLLNIFNPEVRFLIGKQRMIPFFKAHADIEYFQVDEGPEDLRPRVRMKQDKADIAEMQSKYVDSHVATANLLKELQKCFAVRGAEKTLRQLITSVRHNVMLRYVAAAPNALYYKQASDADLDASSTPARWSDGWQFVVLLRHLHCFLRKRPEFIVAEHKDVLSVDELRALRVTYDGSAESSNDPAGLVFQLSKDLRELLGGRQLCLQVLVGRSKGDEFNVQVEKEWHFG
eukprot:TRINITY_DN18418_c0_g1_i1.p1 TRINITY_DN18418_c0_g1~~TRINITY_DN18418_c0_g1_i1.p1  ORF type:complete len:411 (-),score=76.57 TRINITY_DN18418_c0_g1_i1:460-1527(-)